jgi:hypothetical protein
MAGDGRSNLRGCDEINERHTTTASFSKARVNLRYFTTTVVSRDCMVTCKNNRDKMALKQAKFVNFPL